jgi:hypothetical protein
LLTEGNFEIGSVPEWLTRRRGGRNPGDCAKPEDHAGLDMISVTAVSPVAEGTPLVKSSLSETVIATNWSRRV